ncbi:MAG: HDIG domain-containing protein [Clostridiales bacterium]|nr:HDIG domain-containing protein [Clostridiales bacterium]
MKEDASQKIKKWTGKDIALNVIVYFLNVAVLCGIFSLCVYMNGIDVLDTDSFMEFFTAPGNIVRYLVLIGITATVMWLFFFFEDRDFLKSAVNSEMLFLAIELSLLVAYFLGRFVNIYLRPLTITAMLTLFLKNRRSAIFEGVIFSILMLLIDNLPNSTVPINPLWVFMISISSCVLTLYLMFKLYSRLKMFMTGFLISIPAVIFMCLGLLDGDFSNLVQNIICSLCSGPVAVAIFFVLLPLFESMFKRITCFKLAELTDHKAGLIKKMIREAPGTFNHAIVVSNIAEACATAIEEDALLARTCAYYHDIGKLRRPEFFGENQPDGFNPHDDLTPELSTNIIKSHTSDGYQLLLKHRLPVEIADVCMQHHGTMPIVYFYDKAKKFTDGEVDIKPYCYQGPKPQSKISAIIMIADSCEAATRTLKDRSRDNVKKVVRKIVNERMELGQFEECEITIKELNIIIHTVVNNLTGIYHSRVEYPKVNLDGLREKSEENN